MRRRPDENEQLFSGLKVPEPPEELRHQVLSRAGQVLEGRPRRDPWTRIWESRPARLAWITSVLALTVWHVAVPVGDSGAGGDRATSTGRASEIQEDFAAITNLPRLSLDATPITAASRTLEETEADPRSPVPPAPAAEEDAS